MTFLNLSKQSLERISILIQTFLSLLVSFTAKIRIQETISSRFAAIVRCLNPAKHLNNQHVATIDLPIKREKEWLAEDLKERGIKELKRRSNSVTIYPRTLGRKVLTQHVKYVKEFLLTLPRHTYSTKNRRAWWNNHQSFSLITEESRSSNSYKLKNRHKSLNSLTNKINLINDNNLLFFTSPSTETSL